MQVAIRWRRRPWARRWRQCSGICCACLMTRNKENAMSLATEAQAQETVFTQADGATLEQAGTLIEHHLQSLWARPEWARQIPPLMLWGPPGIGKSTLIRDLCRRSEERRVGKGW